MVFRYVHKIVCSKSYPVEMFTGNDVYSRKTARPLKSDKRVVSAKAVVTCTQVQAVRVFIKIECPLKHTKISLLRFFFLEFKRCLKVYLQQKYLCAECIASLTPVAPNGCPMLSEPPQLFNFSIGIRPTFSFSPM